MVVNRFVSESVHWYLIKDRFEEVVLIVKKIAHVNKKDVSEIMQQNLQNLQAKMDKASGYLLFILII